MPSSRPASPTSASSPSRCRSEEAAIATHVKLHAQRGPPRRQLRRQLRPRILLHLLVAASHLRLRLRLPQTGSNWGENAITAGAIQATMVSSLPLPPKQRELDTGVLTSETPSPAPIDQGKDRAAARTQQVAIPEKITKPIKQAEKPTPAPPKHPQPAPEQPTKAATGETAGVRIPQATMELKNGTASIAVQDRTFGARFAYYVNIVNQKSRRTGTPRKPTHAPPSARALRSSSTSTAMASPPTPASKSAAAHPASISPPCAPYNVSKASAPSRRVITSPSNTPSTTSRNNFN